MQDSRVADTGSLCGNDMCINRLLRHTPVKRRKYSGAERVRAMLLVDDYLVGENEHFRMDICCLHLDVTSLDIG